MEASGCEAGVGQLGDQTNGPLVRGACLRVCSHLMAAQGIVISSPHRPPAAQNGTIVPFNWNRVGAESLEQPMTPHYRTQGSPGSRLAGRGWSGWQRCSGLLGDGREVDKGSQRIVGISMLTYAPASALTVAHMPALTSISYTLKSAPAHTHNSQPVMTDIRPSIVNPKA